MIELRWCGGCDDETAWEPVGEVVEGLSGPEWVCVDCGSAIVVMSFEAELHGVHDLRRRSVA